MAVFLKAKAERVGIRLRGADPFGLVRFMWTLSDQISPMIAIVAAISARAMGVITVMTST